MLPVPIHLVESRRPESTALSESRLPNAALEPGRRQPDGAACAGVPVHFMPFA